MRLFVRALLSTAVSAAGAAFWTALLTRLRQRGQLSAASARKLMHVTTAPLFLLTVPLYPSHALSRFLAASVPLSYALSIARDPDHNALVRAVARKQPGGTDASATASYALATSIVTVLGWRSSAATYVAVAALCFGDGLAGVIGSRLRSPPLPHCGHKTVAGSLSCFVATLLSSATLFRFTPLASPSGAALVLCAGVATVVETLPVQDNLSVPLSTFVVAKLCAY